MDCGGRSESVGLWGVMTSRGIRRATSVLTSYDGVERCNNCAQQTQRAPSPYTRSWGALHDLGEPIQVLPTLVAKFRAATGLGQFARCALCDSSINLDEGNAEYVVKCAERADHVAAARSSVCLKKGVMGRTKARENVLLSNALVCHCIEQCMDCGNRGVLKGHSLGAPNGAGDQSGVLKGHSFGGPNGSLSGTILECYCCPKGPRTRTTVQRCLPCTSSYVDYPVDYRLPEGPLIDAHDECVDWLAEREAERIAQIEDRCRLLRRVLYPIAPMALCIAAFLQPPGLPPVSEVRTVRWVGDLKLFRHRWPANVFRSLLRSFIQENETLPRCMDCGVKTENVGFHPSLCGGAAPAGERSIARCLECARCYLGTYLYADGRVVAV
jgi:hypothetical protein